MCDTGGFHILNGVLVEYTGPGGQVTVPDGVREIGRGAFHGCTALTSVRLPEGLSLIREHAFRGCTALRGVALPDGLEHIGNYAFSGCRSLEAIDIPNGVRSIGSGAFQNNASLGRITLPDSLEALAAKAFQFCLSLGEAALPAGLARLGDRAFAGCGHLHRVLFPAGLECIGREAFLDCAALERLSLPDGLRHLGDKVFADCGHLHRVLFPAGLECIGREAFLNCTALERLSLPDGLSSVGERAFEGCVALTDITLPCRLARVEAWAFCDVRVLHVRQWPEGLENAVNREALRQLDVDDLTSVPDALRMLAIDTFVSETGQAFPPDKVRRAQDFLRENALRLLKEALERLPLLRYLCAHRLISAGDLDTFLDAAIAQGNGEAQYNSVYVYKDFGDTENHFTQKAKMFGFDDSLVLDMDENWRENPHSGESCIRCRQVTQPTDWGGWLFLNGWLAEGETVPRLNDGSMDGQGLDLSGAEALRFWARGERGGERVEFFTCGFGYDGEWGVPTVKYPDSCPKRSLGYVDLGSEWQEYAIDLTDADMGSIACGFGYVLSGGDSGVGDKVFYLDDIRFEGDFSARDAHYMLRSYETDNLYIKNAAFSYDNALAAMAFLSEGRRAEAAELLDSFVYAVTHDRYLPGRVRNAYAAGDIAAFPGWDDSARLPGWYDAGTGQWYEDRYQTGSNVGNTAYVSLALLQYDAIYGSEAYLNTARALMDWVIDSCSDGGPGFTAGYDGWPEGGADTTYPFSYKSIEHNIDAWAAFRQLYARTGEARYAEAADSALAFIRSMYDSDRHIFYTGTLDDGMTPSTENLVLDAQVWACLALDDEFAPYEASLDAVAAMRTPEGGYPFCASNANGGWWAEGTAYTALMYRLRGEDARAEEALEALEGIQLEDGLFPAATVDNLSTGFGLFDGSAWEYGTAPHIAPTAWFVMAINGFNPYSFNH